MKDLQQGEEKEKSELESSEKLILKNKLEKGKDEDLKDNLDDELSNQLTPYAQVNLDDGLKDSLNCEVVNIFIVYSFKV